MVIPLTDAKIQRGKNSILSGSPLPPPHKIMVENAGKSSAKDAMDKETLHRLGSGFFAFGTKPFQTHCDILKIF